MDHIGGAKTSVGLANRQSQNSRFAFTKGEYKQNMNELQRALIGDSAAAPPDHILDGVTSQFALQIIAGAPHSIYQELWHITFWQKMTLDWVSGTETPFPATPSAGFPQDKDIAGEPWDQLCRRFFQGSGQAADIAGDLERLDESVRCPSRPGNPVRVMSVREQLESLAAHNAYHFGRIVLLRQLNGAWPPASGGFNW